MLMRLGAADGSPEAQAERDALAARQNEIYQQDFERRQQEQQLQLQREAFDLNKGLALRKEAHDLYYTPSRQTSKSVSYSASPRDLPAVGFAAEAAATESTGGYVLDSAGGKVILVAGVILAAIFIARN